MLSIITVLNSDRISKGQGIFFRELKGREHLVKM
jgi:hypothetical protein